MMPPTSLSEAAREPAAPSELRSGGRSAPLSAQQERAGPSAGPRSGPAPSILFDTVLQRPSGVRLGFSVVPVTLTRSSTRYGSSGLYVKSLQSGGAIDLHNRSRDADKRICAGDCIVRAGSAVLHAHGIMRALSDCNQVQVCVLKQVYLASPAADSELQCLAVAEESLPADFEEYLAGPYSTSSLLPTAASRAAAPILAPTRVSPAPAFAASPCDPSRVPYGSIPMAPPGLEPRAAGSVREQRADLAARARPAEGEAQCREALADAASEVGLEGKNTTLILRHVPYTFSRDMLAELLNQVGFAGRYDFIYMRMNLRAQTPFTYAFVNLVTPEAAEACRQALNGFSGWGDQPCVVSWANSEQGLGANIERYRNSPVMHESVPDAFKPAVYKDGVRQAFPPPTKPLKAPPIRKPSAKAEEEVSGLREASASHPSGDEANVEDQAQAGQLFGADLAASIEGGKCPAKLGAGAGPLSAHEGEAQIPLVLRMSF